MIKAKTFGWRNPQLDQISRIDQGLKDLGVDLDSDEPDFVYSNNDRYDDILEYADSLEKRPKVILNVLDLQINNPDYPIDLVEAQLKQADAITSISHATQKQVKEVLGLDSTVIYNPVKDVYRDKEIPKTNRFLYVGRANDPRKRYWLIEDFLNQTKESIIVCGSEKPQKGYWVGIVDDSTLNDLYNASNFVLMLAEWEGLCLPMLETIITEGFPIITSDNPISKEELIPDFCIAEPNVSSIVKTINNIARDYSKHREIIKGLADKYKIKFNKKTIAQNILNVYESIK